MNKYGVIGNPVEHSLSPRIHQAFAEQTKQSLVYEKIKAPIDDFIAAVQEFQQTGGKGLNVTLPFKHEAFQIATQQSTAAIEAQAASVLHFRDNDVIYADNFDGLGLIQDLTTNHDVQIAGKKILLVGAGGAAQGILGPLLKKLPAQVMIANRTADKAQQLALKFHKRGPVKSTGFSALTPTIYDVIIHVTSVGHQDEAPMLPSGLIDAHTCCYDISYGKAAQPFLNWAKDQGATKCVDGLGMLVEHNAAVFHLWFNVFPDTKPVIALLKRS